jgi:hypothetical protein
MPASELSRAPELSLAPVEPAAAVPPAASSPFVAAAIIVEQPAASSVTVATTPAVLSSFGHLVTEDTLATTSARYLALPATTTAVAPAPAVVRVGRWCFFCAH